MNTTQLPKPGKVETAAEIGGFEFKRLLEIFIANSCIQGILLFVS